MAGLYFHIPFCKQKCHYCDFYSKRDSNGIDILVKSELKELVLRRNYLNNECIETIYFGGGTPSLLNTSYINDILNAVRSNYDVSLDCEITLEANPDDLTDDYLNGLYNCGINRLSVGIQSFNDTVLKYLGRRHDSKQLKYIIETAQKVGFNNISVDLIFGIPEMKLSTYLQSLNRVIQLNIQHISAYSLTISEGTLFHKKLINNTLNEVSEDSIIDQFNLTMDLLSEHGFVQYEISNYAKEGFVSRHNSSYWENIMYLGIGPSAHSYNLVSRQWNISDTQKYCDQIDRLNVFFEIEYLTHNDKFNEYIITGLRTSKGVSKSFIYGCFDSKIFIHFEKIVKDLESGGFIFCVADNVVLTRKGLLICDHILQRLYYTS